MTETRGSNPSLLHPLVPFVSTYPLCPLARNEPPQIEGHMQFYLKHRFTAPCFNHFTEIMSVVRPTKDDIGYKWAQRHE